MRPKQAALEPGGGPGSPDPALPLNHKIFYHSCSVQRFKLDHFINWWRQTFSSEWVDNWKNQVNSFPYITLLIIDYFPVIVSFTFSSLDKFVISSWHNSPQQAKLPKNRGRQNLHSGSARNNCRTCLPPTLLIYLQTLLLRTLKQTPEVHDAMGLIMAICSSQTEMGVRSSI